MLSSRRAVASSPLDEQPAMSPAPTKTTPLPGGGGAVTVIADVPLCPSLVAVIVAAPTAAPLTRPVPLTVAIALSLLPHVTTRPLNGFPLASFGVAVSCTLDPT